MTQGQNSLEAGTVCGKWLRVKLKAECECFVSHSEVSCTSELSRNTRRPKHVHNVGTAAS